MRRRFRWYMELMAFLLLLSVSGCADLSSLPLPPPSVAPAAQPAASLKIDASQIPPMYRRLLAVDLSAVVRVAMARNLDIQAAQQRVEASRGAYESSVGAVFPSITPKVPAFPGATRVNRPSCEVPALGPVRRASGLPTSL